MIIKSFNNKQKPNKMSKQVAVIASETNVPKVLYLLQAELNKQKHIEESVYKTNGKFGLSFTELEKETKVENILKGLSIIVAKKKAYDQAASLAGLTSYPLFKFEGSTLEEWVGDVRLRIAIIENKDTIDKLKEFKSQAEKLLSEEDQKAILFDNISKFISGLNG